METNARSSPPTELLLPLICKLVDASVRAAEAERMRARGSQGDFSLELLLPQIVDVRVEIRKEKAPHKEPHLHVKHSDKIDASLRLSDLGVIVGRIDRRTHRGLRERLLPKRAALMEIWNALEDGDSAKAHELISEL
jgi:hypothetical protein